MARRSSLLSRLISPAVFIAGFAVVVFAGVTSSVHAQVVWGGGTGPYTTGANWIGGVAPTSAQEVAINSGTAEVNLSDTQFQRGANTLINGGTLALSNARFTNAVGGPATFTLQSGSLTQASSTYFLVANNNVGVFNQTGGLVDVTLSRGFFLTDGNGQKGTYNLSGGTLSVAMSGDTSELHNMWIGRGVNLANGYQDLMTVDGGSFNLNVTGGSVRNLLVAKNSSFQIDSGTVAMSGLQSAIIGMTRQTGTISKMLVNGGTTSIAVSNAFVLGSGVSGEMTLSNGFLAIEQVGGIGGHFRMGDQAASTAIAAGGDASTFSTLVMNGGTLDIAGNFTLATDSFNTSTVTMSAGELYAADILAGSGSATFNFQGGLIQLLGDKTSLVSQGWFNAAPNTVAVFDAGNDLTTISIVPEPTGLLLAAVGVATAVLVRRRNR